MQLNNPQLTTVSTLESSEIGMILDEDMALVLAAKQQSIFTLLRVDR